jgi:hypothetical protein
MKSQREGSSCEIAGRLDLERCREHRPGEQDRFETWRTIKTRQPLTGEVPRFAAPLVKFDLLDRQDRSEHLIIAGFPGDPGAITVENDPDVLQMSKPRQ